MVEPSAKRRSISCASALCAATPPIARWPRRRWSARPSGAGSSRLAKLLCAQPGRLAVIGTRCVVSGAACRHDDCPAAVSDELALLIGALDLVQRGQLDARVRRRHEAVDAHHRGQLLGGAARWPNPPPSPGHCRRSPSRPRRSRRWSRRRPIPRRPRRAPSCSAGTCWKRCDRGPPLFLLHAPSPGWSALALKQTYPGPLRPLRRSGVKQSGGSEGFLRAGCARCATSVLDHYL